MNSHKRPLSVTILACLYLAVGAAGFVGHFKASLASPRNGIWIELTELAAIVCGVFLLKGQNWARWAALAWMLFHVILSVFHPVRELVVHSFFCVVVAWILFRPAASQYFRRARNKPI